MTTQVLGNEIAKGIDRRSFDSLGHANHGWRDPGVE
jgi:hypothetical protein